MHARKRSSQSDGVSSVSQSEWGNRITFCAAAVQQAHLVRVGALLLEMFCCVNDRPYKCAEAALFAHRLFAPPAIHVHAGRA